MNTSEMAKEAVAMVAFENDPLIKVRVTGNKVAVTLTRDPMNRAAFDRYNTVVDRLWDALTALGAKFNLERGSGVEMKLRAFSNAKVEMYSSTFEVVSGASK